MTPYAALTSLAGLSLREACEFHQSRLDTVKRWSNGTNRAPSGALDELRQLIANQERAASECLEQINSNRADFPDVAEIEIGYPADDHEAQSLGWPCVGAFRAMAARVIARAPITVRLVPRGSTLGTAASADLRDTRDR